MPFPATVATAASHATRGGGGDDKRLRLPPILQSGSSGSQRQQQQGGSSSRDLSRPASSRRSGGPTTAAGAAAPTAAAATGRPVAPSAADMKRNAVWARVLRVRAHGRDALRSDGDVPAALRELTKVLALQGTTPGGLLDPVGSNSKGLLPPGTPSVEPAWVCAEEIVGLANREAVRCGATAEPAEEGNRFFREALKLVYSEGCDGELAEDDLGIFGRDKEEGGGAVGGRTGGSAKGKRPATSSRKAAGPDYFQSNPQLRPHLCAVVLNNIAVQMRANGAPLPKVLRLLREALLRTASVMATAVLYNIAATLAAMGQLEAALAGANTCVELCGAYLLVDPRGEEETPLLAAEVADSYTTFVVAVAGRMIAAQLLTATLCTYPAVVPPDSGAEAHHCRAAVACAGRYLPGTHPLHRRCAARLAAAEARAADPTLWINGGGDEEADRGLLPPPPPQVALMAALIDFPYSPSPMMSEAPLAADEAPIAAFVVSPTSSCAGGGGAAAGGGVGMAAGPVFASVRLSRMLLLWGATKLPVRVRAYLKRAAGLVAKAEKDDEHRAKLAAAAALASRARKPTGKAATSGGRRVRSPTTGYPSNGEFPDLPDDGSRPETPAAPAEAAPVPLIVTGIPRPAFNRYHALKHSAMGYLDRETALADQHQGGDGYDDDEEQVTPMTARLRAQQGGLHSAASTHPTVGSRRRPSTATTIPIGSYGPADGSGAETASYDWESAQLRKRRMSALYYAAHGTNSANNTDIPAVASTSAVGGGAGLGAAPASTAPFLQGQLTVVKSVQHVRAMDSELLRYSRLVVDTVPEVRYAAARAIQRGYRCHLAYLLVRRMAAAAEVERLRGEAGHTALRAYRDYRACAPAKAELRRLRAAHELMLRVALVQRYLYERRSVEEWGVRCLALHRRLLEEKRQRELEQASALRLQAWWRMTLAQRQLWRARGAVHTLQCAWRCCRARMELAHRRVLKRIAYENFLAVHRPDIIYIQRWFLACVARRAVAGLLEGKQRAAAAHLDSIEAAFTRDMGRLAPRLAEAGAAMERVLSVLHGARSRRRARGLHAALLRIKACLEAWVHRTRGLEMLDRLRRARGRARLLQSRREEVLDATLLLQGAARRWLHRRELAAAAAAQAVLDSHASTIQAAYRAYVQRAAGGSAAAWRVRERLQRETATMALMRVHSATLIQATYRMHRTRTATRDYLQFMLVDRHAMARRIQGAWHRYTGRRAAGQLRARTEARAARQADGFYRVSVIRTQSVVRMFLARSRFARLWAANDEEDNNSGAAVASRLWYSPHQRFAAARAVQTAWRAYAARCYATQVRLATAHFAAERTGREALHGYATIIQKIARRWLAARRVRKLAEEANRPVATPLEPRPPRPMRAVTSAGVAAGGGGGYRRPQAAVSRPATTGSGEVHGEGAAFMACAATTSDSAAVILAVIEQSRPGTAGAAPVGVHRTGSVRSQSASRSRDSGELSDFRLATIELRMAAPPVTLSRPSTGILSRATPRLWGTGSITAVGGTAVDEACRAATAAAVERPGPVCLSRPRMPESSPPPASSQPASLPFCHSEENEETNEEEELVLTGRQPFTALLPTQVPPRDTSMSLISRGMAPRVSKSATPQEGPLSGTASLAATEVDLTTEMTRTTTAAVAITRVEAAGRRGSASQRSAFPPAESYTAQQHAAALAIQTLWRGYLVRCEYEYYYEEYEEEV